VLGRRAALRGAGVSIALPFLAGMRPARGLAAAPKRRLFVVFTDNGPGFVRGGESVMVPAGGETDFTLTPELKPFEPHRKDLTVVAYLDNAAGALSGNPGHHSAYMTALTGADILPNGALPNPDRDKYWGFGDVSVDQVIAGRFGAETKLRSLELATGEEGGGGIESFITAAGPNRHVPNLRDPARVFDRLFADFTPPGPAAQGPAMTPAIDRVLRNRASVLDVVKQDYARLRAKLGREDAATLDRHLAALRELERSLSVGGAGGASAPTASCAKPARPASTRDFLVQTKAHLDAAAMAFACDITRIGTLMLRTSDKVFSWLGHSHRQHAFAHNSGDYNFPKNDAAAEQGLRQIEIWLAQHIADFVAKLKSMPEGAGTVWDNTLVLWVHELAAGSSHSHRKHVYILLGNIDGKFRTGRVVRAAGTNNDLFVTLLNAFGVPATSFGSARHNTRAIDLA
jgi:hypothetical protein